jgi:hypothetical protein
MGFIVFLLKPQLAKDALFRHDGASAVVVSFPSSSFVRFRAAHVPEKLRKIETDFIRVGRRWAIGVAVRGQKAQGKRKSRAVGLFSFCLFTFFLLLKP